VGLDTGADDYVVKPVDLNELAARLRSLVRRSVGQLQETIGCAGVELNPAARSVSYNGEIVTLSTREFDLLHALMRNTGRVLSREQLEQQMYSWGHEVESNTIEVHIHHLRRKLGSELIQTVRGGATWCSASRPAHERDAEAALAAKPLAAAGAGFCGGGLAGCGRHHLA
jgi:DNA-binding response OmpR family regulator